MPKSRGWTCLCSLVDNAQLLDFLSNDTSCEWVTRLSTNQRPQKSLPCTPMGGIKHSWKLSGNGQGYHCLLICVVFHRKCFFFFGVFKASGSMIFQPHLAPICWFPYCSHGVELLSSLWHFSLSGKSGLPVVVFSLMDNHTVQYASPSRHPLKEHSTLD